MQYKNPIDNELINSAEAVCVSLQRMFELYDMPQQNTGMVSRLRDALDNARVEMQLQAEAMRDDFVMPTEPPSSND